MRREQNNMFPELFQGNGTKELKIIREYREEYQKIDALLRKYPELLVAAHQDLQTLCNPILLANAKPTLQPLTSFALSSF